MHKLTLLKSAKVCHDISFFILWTLYLLLSWENVRLLATDVYSHVNFFPFKKGAADTSVNAYLSIYFAYTPFYGSLTLYEWVPLSKVQLLSSIKAQKIRLLYPHQTRIFELSLYWMMYFFATCRYLDKFTWNIYN